MKLIKRSEIRGVGRLPNGYLERIAADMYDKLKAKPDMAWLIEATDHPKPSTVKVPEKGIYEAARRLNKRGFSTFGFALRKGEYYLFLKEEIEV